MTHPARQAADRLHSEVMTSLADNSIKAGDTRWFEMQAKGHALSMLRGMMSIGAHESPAAAELFRKAATKALKLDQNGDDIFEAH